MELNYFKNPDKRSHLYVQTNVSICSYSRSIQDIQVTEAGLSYFQKINLTSLKMYCIKQKNETVFYRNLIKYDNLKFKEVLNRELMKHDAHNINHEVFQETALSVLDVHPLLTKKHFRANHTTFATKEFGKVVMKRAKLGDAYLKKKRTEATKAA